jgi:Tfp pilus assembly protein PilO
MDLRLSQNFNSHPLVKEKAKQHSIVELIALAIIIVLFGWFLILPKKTQLSSEQQQLSVLQTQQSQVHTTLTTLQSLEQQLNTQATDISELDQALPLSYKFSALPELVQSLANSVGVTLASASFSPSEQAPDAGNVALLSNPYGVQRALQQVGGTIVASGNFGQLDDFLKKIESSGRILNVNSIAVSGSGNSSLTLRLDVTAYFLAP